MIEVAKRTTSICPRCGSHMVYFNTISQLQFPDESGRHVKAIMSELEYIASYCLHCHASYPLRRTIYGILPDQMAEEMHLGSKDPEYEHYNPIGNLEDIEITKF